MAALTGSEGVKLSISYLQSLPMTLKYLLPFSSPEALRLDISGGKGANLARLTQAGLPVPPGVILSTAAYRIFVEVNQLAGVLTEALTANPVIPLNALEDIATRIRQRFAAAVLPADVIEEIGKWYAQAGRPLLAVRSSATTEDLPSLSFAGQQDTFLNIRGEEQLIKAVVAREYGLPAVVGVDQATRRLRTGQRVRLDGSSGRIDLLGDDGAKI